MEYRKISLKWNEATTIGPVPNFLFFCGIFFVVSWVRWETNIWPWMVILQMYIFTKNAYFLIFLYPEFFLCFVIIGGLQLACSALSPSTSLSITKWKKSFCLQGCFSSAIPSLLVSWFKFNFYFMKIVTF